MRLYYHPASTGNPRSKAKSRGIFRSWCPLFILKEPLNKPIKWMMARSKALKRGRLQGYNRYANMHVGGRQRLEPVVETASGIGDRVYTQ